MPDLLAAFISRLLQLFYQLVVIAHKTRLMLAECDHTGAGQCCYIDNNVAFLSNCISKGIAEYHSAFGIGI